MTQLEKFGYIRIAASEKTAATDNEALKRELLQNFCSDDDPEVIEAISKGSNKFKESVRDRILREYPEAVSRCPSCSKVLRTPRAKQCMWCGFDWHNS